MPVVVGRRVASAAVKPRMRVSSGGKLRVRSHCGSCVRVISGGSRVRTPYVREPVAGRPVVAANGPFLGSFPAWLPLVTHCVVARASRNSCVGVVSDGVVGVVRAVGTEACDVFISRQFLPPCLSLWVYRLLSGCRFVKGRLSLSFDKLARGAELLYHVSGGYSRPPAQFYGYDRISVILSRR